MSSQFSLLKTFLIWFVIWRLNVLKTRMFVNLHSTDRRLLLLPNPLLIPHASNPLVAPLLGANLFQ